MLLAAFDFAADFAARAITFSAQREPCARACRVHCRGFSIFDGGYLAARRGAAQLMGRPAGRFTSSSLPAFRADMRDALGAAPPARLSRNLRQCPAGHHAVALANGRRL